jgi:Tfp pilus assembly protein PilF
VAHDEEDADVRRELGYLFLDLDSPEPAARQFQRAVEIDPDESLNWMLLVEALRRSGDADAAAEWLRRAPPAAQDRLRGG